MDVKHRLKPNVSERMAKDLVKNLYGLEVTSIKSMNSYEDQNFYIRVKEEHQNPYIKNVLEAGYTLKITNPQKSSKPEHFYFMHETMVHLRAKNLTTPLPLQNLRGNTWTLKKVPLLCEDESLTTPNYCGIHILTYIPGCPISSDNCTEDVLYQWGRLLAKFHNATEELAFPILKEKNIFWNLEHLPEIKNYMSALDKDKKELVNNVLSRYAGEVDGNIPKLRKGFTHGDFNQNNVLIQKETSESGELIFKVNGILDFEEIQHGLYVYDVGVMMAYGLLEYEGSDVLEGPGHALAGYLNIRPLSDLELSLLKICIEGRLCQSLVMCSYAYSHDSTNTYLLDSARTGWTRLDMISSVDNKELLKRWKNVKHN